MKTNVQIDWNGECLGAWMGHEETTIVRRTTDGRFAVVAAATKRIIKIFADCLHARRYNFAIHGDRLGE